MRKIKLLLSFLSPLLFFPIKTFAVCPVCTIAVIGGIELSRWLGVDDTISGVWVGALIVSLSLWLVDWLRKKNIRFPFRKILVFIFFYAITILTLYWKKFIFYPGCSKINIFNKPYDKLMVGIVFGSIAFIIGFWINEWLKKRNNNKVYFPFQRVVIPIILLIITSVIFHFITKCNPLQKFGL